MIRISLGLENRAEDNDTLIGVLGEIARQSPSKVDNPLAANLPQTAVEQQMDAFARAVAQRVYTQLA